MVFEATTATEFMDVIHDTSEQKHGKKYILIDFYANWCGPCRVFAPTFVKLSDKYTNVMFIKVNIDNLNEIAEKYNIRSIPTFMFFETGNSEKPCTEAIIGGKKDLIKNKLEYYNNKIDDKEKEEEDDF
jgi:thioredoxin 1